MSEKFDLIVIGAGPGGYVSAIKASQLGMKVACIEKRKTLGGTCLNVGCIPSKALLESSHKFAEANHDFADHGIEAKGIKINITKLQERKNKVVSDLTKGIDGLFAKNKITRLVGTAKVLGEGKIELDGKIIEGKNILIATGSDVAKLPNVEIDEKTIVSSTGALELNKVPKKLVVIGGGVIGLEMGSVWARLGAEVEVIEYFDRIMVGTDNEIAKNFQKILQKQGFKFKLSTKVNSAKKTKNGVELEVEPSKGGDTETIKADVALVAIGRSPYTEGLGLQEAGIELDERGRIKTNKHFETNIKNIYAIGDVIKGAMLAHKAEEEGVAAVEIMAGQAGHINYNTIPGVVYTHPEVATIGQTEEQVKESGVAYKVGKFPFMANSRGRAVGETEGFVKMIARADNDEILGVHIIGCEAGNLIHEAGIIMEFKGASEDLARTCHAHPTLNEALKEAALATFSKPIHI